MVLDDIRKTFEAVMGQLSPSKAQEVAKRYLGPDAAKEQVSKTAHGLVDLSKRMREWVRSEVAAQMRSMGAATQDDVDALRKRVRDLERAVGRGAGTGTARKTTRAKTTRAKTTAGKGSTGASSRTRKPTAAP